MLSINPSWLPESGMRNRTSSSCRASSVIFKYRGQNDIAVVFLPTVDPARQTPYKFGFTFWLPTCIETLFPITATAVINILTNKNSLGASVIFCKYSTTGPKKSSAAASSGKPGSAAQLNCSLLLASRNLAA